MKRIGSHFSFDRHQRNGILLLCVFLTFSQVLLWYVDRTATQVKKYTKDPTLVALQNRRDSLKKLHIAKNIRQTRKFNPNYLDEFRAYNLGLDLDAYKRLKEFRQGGNQLASVEQFRQVTQIDDSLFRLLSPLMIFPSKNKQSTYHSRAIGSANGSASGNRSASDYGNTSRSIGDLNAVSAEELRLVRGIGEKLSKRIVAYRNFLGGYSTDEQLFEVYHLPEEAARQVLARYEVRNPPAIEKINVNSASFKELLRLPYIDYELTKNIVKFRQERGSLTGLEELMQIDSFPHEKFERIALYLLAE